MRQCMTLLAGPVDLFAPRFFSTPVGETDEHIKARDGHLQACRAFLRAPGNQPHHLVALDKNAWIPRADPIRTLRPLAHRTR